MEIISQGAQTLISKKVKNNIFPKHILSMHSINKEHMETLFAEAKMLAHANVRKIGKILEGKILGVMFFQPSTRTRLSFEIAMQKLGGNVSGFADINTTRSGDFYKESFRDAVQVVGQMSDCIVVRHFRSDELKQVEPLSPVPLINAGDGDNEHPTQALSDLWLMHKTMGFTLDGVQIGLVGDPECRVMRSIIIGLAKFSIKKLLFLLPPNKTISLSTLSFLKENNILWETASHIEELLSEADVINMIPFYLSDFNAPVSGLSERAIFINEKYRLTREKLFKVGRHIPIMHCGPRGAEIDIDVDDLPQALYFKQVKDAVFIRMALLKKLIEQREVEKL